MIGTKRLLRGLTFFAIVCLPAAGLADVPPWRTVTPEELAMRSEPKAPGAPAIILYMEVDRDASLNREERYYQIKILTDEGRSAANVQITFDSNVERVRDIEARTIRKDGTIVPFTGEIFEAPLAKGSDQRLMSKTFALVDAEVGSVVEYRYSRRFNVGFELRWLLANNLFTREARYSFRAGFPTRYSSPRGLPPGTAPLEVDKKKNRVRLHTRDVPALVEEEYSPPLAESQYVLNFIPAVDWYKPAKDAETFWTRHADQQRNSTRYFMNGSGSLRKVILELAPESDAPEVRLRKIFDACAALRNRSYEPDRSEDEMARADEREVINVRDMWKRQYGWAREIDLLFMAMAREAGFTVAEVWLANREKTFFDPQQMDTRWFNWLYIGVMLNGKEQYFSPGTRFVPFGQIVWSATAVKALRIDEKQHTWIRMPAAAADENRTRQVARLKLSADGELSGTVSVTYTGHEASWRRNREHHEDAAHRREFLEKDLTGSLSGEAIAKVLKDPDWEGSGDFVVEYELTLPDRVLTAGNRRLLPAGWFVANKNGFFRRAERIAPIYFRYPWDNEEDVQIELPPGWTLDGAPEARRVDQKVMFYSMEVGADRNIVRTKRRFRHDLTLVTASSYDAIRKFYEDMRAGDGLQVVLKTAAR
jgi:hypothetical protein